MVEDPTATELPEQLREYFWDYNPDQISWDRNRHTIILRLLARGGMPSIRWLRKHMSDDEIREFIIRRRGRGIDPRRLRFWSVLVGIPGPDVDEWIEGARRNPWHSRTHA